MLKKLFGAAVMAAAAYAVVPAHAANTMGCSGTNLEKTESATEVMADGPGKFAAEREIAQAQEALLSGNMRSCAMHLSRASHPEASHPDQYQWGTISPAPVAPTTDGQFHWKPMQPAL